MNPNGFRPAWWLPGAHAQTLGARLLRSRAGVSLRRERLELPDRDFLDLDWIQRVGSFEPGDQLPLVLVLHGLEGSAQSKYALEIYRRLAEHGVGAVGLNFRSCSGQLNRLPRLYHSGETEDLAYVLALLAERYPGRSIGAVGFSLGGNVLLKYLGEKGQKKQKGSLIEAAAAISVPFKLAAGARHLDRGFARTYRWFLVRRLRNKMRAKADLLRPLLDLRHALSASSFYDFDDRATAPLHGFRSAQDYYERSSSSQFLRHIDVPTLLVHSLDDPFLPPNAVPLGIERTNPKLSTMFTKRGGHVGFVAGPPWAPVFWAERTAAEWVAARLGGRAAGQQGEPRGRRGTGRPGDRASVEG